MAGTASFNRAGWLIAAAVIAVIAFFALTPPLPQDPAYHAFADQRALFGIRNFWNVTSNLALVVVGAWGVVFMFRHAGVTLPGVETAYIVFFSGVFLTGFGSAWYHLAPANESLVWDRLPMTIGFAGFFALVVGEFVSPETGRRLVIPMLIAGIAAVEYWAFTEARGVGDLRPYAIVAFLPMLLILAIFIACKPAIGNAHYFWLMLLFYLLAKLAEHFDAAIFSAGGIVSGHTLKHFFAAMTPATALYALHQRRRAPASARG